jgi:hypothetical protein
MAGERHPSEPSPFRHFPIDGDDARLSGHGVSVLTAALFKGLINLNGSGRYVHWGFIQISVANLIVIALMIAVFWAALLVPFRRRKERNR